MIFQTLQSSLLLLVILLPLWLIYRILVNKDSRFVLKRELLLFTFFAYTVVVTTATIIPIKATTRSKFPSGHVNLLPAIQTVRKYFKYQSPLYPIELRMLYINFFGNIILFMPLGFLLALINPEKSNFKTILIVSTCASVMIELMQWVGLSFGINRYIDVDDVLLNVAGAVLGFYCYKAFTYIQSRVSK